MGTKGVLAIAAAVAILAMAGLVIAEVVQVSLLVDPAEHMDAGAVAAVVGVGLLVAGVVLQPPAGRGSDCGGDRRWRRGACRPQGPASGRGATASRRRNWSGMSSSSIDRRGTVVSGRAERDG